MHIQFGGSVTYSGEALKNRQLNLSPGEYILALTNGDQERILIPERDEGHAGLAIRISPRKILQYFGTDTSNELHELLKSIENDQSHIHHSGAPIDIEMNSIIQSILHCNYTGPLKHMFIEAKIMELLTLQLAQKKSITLQSSKLNHTLKERLLSVKEHIENTFHQEHSLKALARANGLNEYDLKKYFKILFGKTVFESIRETRLIEAKKMIIDQQLPISEITHHVGYKSTQHFITAFKKRFGYSPSTLFKGG